MYLNVRLHEAEDKDLIDDVGRFTGNKRFTRSDRVRELMRLGKEMEKKSMAVALSTGRVPRDEAPKPTSRGPLVQTKDGWQRIRIFGK